jgi:uncharacterized protein
VPGGAGALVEPVVAFGRALRERGIEVGPGRVETAVRALGCVEARDLDETYWAMRCSLLSRAEDAEAFDDAFASFWRGAQVAGMRLEEEQTVPSPFSGRPQAEGAGSESGGPEGETVTREDLGASESEADGEPVGARFSPAERLRQLDFSDWGPAELAQARPLIARLARTLPCRPSRRLRAASRGSSIDRRATLRRAMRTEAHPLELRRRERASTPRRMLFLIDVSGSMEPYARPLILFAQAVRQATSRLEAFAFGTRLTRITRELAERDPGRAMDRASRAVPDWAGGTRIGENLRVLNAAWGRRGVTRGAVTVIFSDGWERGDVTMLEREMERLHRAARTVIWVNPLAGEAGYQPLAAGMAAALRHVDRFLPGHDLASLEELAAAVTATVDNRSYNVGPMERLAIGGR